MVTWLGVYKEVLHNWIVNLGVVHVLQTFHWCFGYFLVGRLEIGKFLDNEIAYDD